MTVPLPQLEARLAALRESLSGAAPPPATDRAIAVAIARAQRAAGRGKARFGAHGFDAWIAWPVGLAAAITVLSFIVRSVPQEAGSGADPVGVTAAQAASFMPVVPIAELERAGDTLVVPARMSRMSLAQFGLPVNPARAADAIDTELLVRPDGAVLAVRFVN
jgi:hypothetical protein